MDRTALFWTGAGVKLDHDHICELNAAQAQDALGMAIGFLAERSRQNLKEYAYGAFI